MPGTRTILRMQLVSHCSTEARQKDTAHSMAFSAAPVALEFRNVRSLPLALASPETVAAIFAAGAGGSSR